MARRKKMENVPLTHEEAEWIRHQREAKLLGRPKKYHPKFCKIVFEKMASGFSKYAAAGAIGISEDTLYAWQKKYKDFSESIRLGELACREHWEHIGIIGATGRIPIDPKTKEPIKFRFNAYAWGLNMKNRFRWGERVLGKGAEQGEGGASVVFNIEMDHDPNKEKVIDAEAKKIE